MRPVYVAGVGFTKFGKREESLERLFYEAAQAAMLDANRYEFDAVFVGAMNPEDFVGESNLSTLVTDYLGLVPAPTLCVETASSTGASLFDAGVFGIASGHMETILVLAGEKMTGISTQDASTILAEVIDRQERLHGATMPALAALITRRYMYDYGMTREELAMVAVKNHFNGTLNEYAHFRKEVTIEEVLNSRMVSDPLRVYDCSPMTDGAVGVVLCAEKRPVRVLGIGHGSDYLAVRHRESLTSFASTRIAARKAYRMAGIEPRDVGVAEVHDAFTSFEIIATEDLGFFPPGRGWTALVSGETSLTGRLPVNPSGGLKARGHPVGASGLAQIAEIVLQLEGRAGRRQVAGARIGLTASIGGFATNNLVTILGTDAAP